MIETEKDKSSIIMLYEVIPEIEEEMPFYEFLDILEWD